MTAIPGIQLKQNAKGETTHIAIDLKKHPEMIPVLKEKGLMPKTTFEKEVETALTVDEVRNRIHEKIKTFYANRRNQPADTAKNR